MHKFGKPHQQVLSMYVFFSVVSPPSVGKRKGVLFRIIIPVITAKKVYSPDTNTDYFQTVECCC